MSLHLGNLSARIRKDELERVFKRFGRCTVQLKDGYGFAVYDFRGDAEKALRELKGRKICGERIYLSWSNKQPKILQRFGSAGRSHGMQYERNYYRAKVDHNKMDREHYNQKEEFLEQDGGIEPKDVDIGRWSDEVDTLQNDGEMEFDRYEPNSGDDRAEEYENRNSGQLADSLSRQASQDKNRRAHYPDNVRGHLTCFRCGAAGHKMRNCPMEGSLHGRKSNHSTHRHERETRSSRNPGSARGGEADRKLSHSEKILSNGRNSPLGNDSDKTNRKDYNRKRRNDGEDRIVETVDGKKSRRSASPPLHCDHKSPKVGKYSPSDRSRSKSRSVHSRSRNIRSKSRSRSSSPFSSLSVSVGQCLSSPSNNGVIHVNLNGSLGSTHVPQAMEGPAEVKQQFEPKISEENICIANFASPSLSGDVDKATNHVLQKVLVETQQLEPNSTEVGPKSQQLSEEREWAEPESREDLKLQMLADKHVRSGDASPADRIGDDLKMDQLTNDGRNSNIHGASCEIQTEDSPEKLREVEELENGKASEVMKSLRANKSDIQASSISQTGSRLGISTEELHRVLKHYGLRDPEENEQHLGVQDYFGSARLWPWEIIYYRKLKKGSISTENYARRVAQNEAFGITDKYIRSSSGWFESTEEQLY